MADDRAPKPEPESLGGFPPPRTAESEVRFPPPRRREEPSVYRRPGPVAPEPAPVPRAAKPQVVVTRPDPPAPVPPAPDAKRPAKKPPAPARVPYSIGLAASELGRPRETLWSRFVMRHPRWAGAGLLLLNGVLFARAAHADRRALLGAIWTGGFALVHRSIWYNITAGMAAGGLWLLVFGIATDEKHQIADWWKVGIIVFVILVAGLGAKLAQTSAIWL